MSQPHSLHMYIYVQQRERWHLTYTKALLSPSNVFHLNCATNP